MKKQLLALIGTIILAHKAIANPSDSVIVIGEARNPGVIAYSREMTLTTAILAAGGYSEWSKVQVYIIRNGAVISHPDVQKIIEDPKSDITLKAWDIITIGQIHPRESALK